MKAALAKTKKIWRDVNACPFVSTIFAVWLSNISRLYVYLVAAVDTMIVYKKTFFSLFAKQ